MRIIPIVNQKGGVGKSTIALNLAYALNDELTVGLYDADLQGSLSNSEVNEGLNIVPPCRDVHLLKTLKFDVLIVDTPPYLTSRLPEILKISDLAIVPTKSSAFDALAIGSTLQLIKEAQRKNPKLKAHILYSMVKHNSSLCREMSEVLEGFGYPVFKNRIVERVDYVRSLMSGGILKSDSKKGKDEFNSFVNEVIDLL